MEKDKALQTLVGAVDLAFKRGAFNLQESIQIVKAVEAFQNSQQEVNLQSEIKSDTEKSE